MIVLVAALRIAARHSLQSLMQLMVALCLVLAGAITVLSRSRSASRSNSLALLAEWPAAATIDAIGPLIDALDLASDDQRPAILAMLTRLLPRLTSADASILSRRQRSRLSEMLLLGDADREADFLLAILKALEQIGDQDTAHTIHHVVTLGAVTAGQLLIMEASTACLLSLETRLHEDRNRAGLLRSTGHPYARAELVRPTCSKPDAQPETLLRAPGRAEL